MTEKLFMKNIFHHKKEINFKINVASSQFKKFNALQKLV
jgi:hypothetical protein